MFTMRLDTGSATEVARRLRDVARSLEEGARLVSSTRCVETYLDEQSRVIGEMVFDTGSDGGT